MARNLPPYDYHVWFKGDKEPTYMYGFSEEHIGWQCESRKPVKIKRVYLKEEPIPESEQLGPKGAVLMGTADYEEGFKVLQEWVDSQGGPPEKVRKKLRELWIDYQKPKRKTTIYSAKKKGRY